MSRVQQQRPQRDHLMQTDLNIGELKEEKKHTGTEEIAGWRRHSGGAPVNAGEKTKE